MTKKNKKTITFADLFAGIGGFHYAFLNVAKKYKLNINCEYVSEIDKYAIENYCKNFNYSNEKIFDINDFQNNLKKTKLDIVFCGFPCQPFSNAGKKRGFEDENRGQIIFKVRDFVKKTKPKIILLENVKYLLKHNNKETYEKIIELFNEIGYNTCIQDHIIVSPSNLNLMQNRQRVFIPLVRKDLQKKVSIKNDLMSFDEFIKNNKIEKFKFDKSVKTNIKDQDLIWAIQAWEEFISYFKNKNVKIPVIYIDEMFGIVDKEKYKRILWYKNYVDKMSLFFNSHKSFITKWEKKFSVLKWKNKKYKKLEWQAGESEFKGTFLQVRQSGLRFRNNKTFPTLVASVQTPIIYRNNNWRYLTTRETARLQNFPEKHIICENDFQAYKQFGNAVNVVVVQYIIEACLLNFIMEIEHE